MNSIRLSSLDDATLRRELSRTIADERAAVVSVLAHIAEFDARRLYLADACSSMHDYCVQVLHLAEGAAYKRIHAARAARRFPRLLEELAEGRLHLSAVCLLAPHLTDVSVDELVAAATHCTKAEIEAWLARRFAPTIAGAMRARVIPVRAAVPVVRAKELPMSAMDPLALPDSLPPGAVNSHVAPAPATHVVQIPIDEETHTLLREVQGLLGHTVRPGDLGAVFQRALVGLRTELLKRKAGATTKPRRTASPPAAGRRTRTIPAGVRRAVWTRDEGRCTFTSDAGRRCNSTRAIEYDHVVPFARGGATSAQGMRLRCRAHNQYEAELAFGTEHMRRMRERPRPEPDRDIEAALRTLGCRGGEARRGALHAAGLGEPRIDQRLRAALQFIGAGAQAVRSAGSP